MGPFNQDGASGQVDLGSRKVWKFSVQSSDSRVPGFIVLFSFGDFRAQALPGISQACQKPITPNWDPVISCQNPRVQAASKYALPPKPVLQQLVPKNQTPNDWAHEHLGKASYWVHGPVGVASALWAFGVTKIPVLLSLKPKPLDPKPPHP